MARTIIPCRSVICLLQSVRGAVRLPWILLMGALWTVAIYAQCAERPGIDELIRVIASGPGLSGSSDIPRPPLHRLGTGEP